MLLALLIALASWPGQATPRLHARATLDGPRSEPDSIELRWLWERRQLRLGVLERDNPPFDILGTGHAYEGITADYAGLLAEQLNLEMTVQVFATFSEAVAALREGDIDLLGTVTSQQALEAGLRLSRPYADDRPVLMAQETHPQVGRAQPFDLAMVNGYRSVRQVSEHYPEARVQVHPSPFSALAALALGQADLYLGNGQAARYLLGRGQLSGIEEVGHAALPPQGIGFAMAQGASPLSGLVDAALGSLSERQHVRIRERWSPAMGSAPRPQPLQLSRDELRWLRDNPKVKVLVDEQWLPLSFRDGKSELRGLSLDVLQLVSRRTGLQFEVQPGGNVTRMVDRVRRGEAQLIAGLQSSPALEQVVGFSRAYLSASRVLVSREGEPAPSSLDDLDGKTLALVWGSAVEDELARYHPQVLPLIVTGPVQALHAVARGQAAAAVLTLDDARPLIARWYPGRLRISASLAMPPAHFAFASARGAVELQGILNKALLSLAPRETDVLVRRWRNPMIVGDGIWTRYRGQILLGFGTAVLLLLLALLWIRSLRRLQVQLRRAKGDAEAANQAKTHFLASMSHEIRTPLHAVLGMLEIARHKAEQGQLDHLAIEVAADAARGLQELIGDILDITRIETGHLQLDPQPVCLREQVSRVVQLFEQQAHDKGLALRLDAQGAVDAQVMLDPLRFKQVLVNLLSNAIKFTRLGQVVVSLRAEPCDNLLIVALKITDTGVGIAEAELDGLGQPFRQASNQRQSPRSSAGLGLGISRSLCEMMGGWLQLRSTLGQGTEVDVQLLVPLVPVDVRHAVAPRAVASQGGRQLRVLVVDDYPANRLLLAQQLDYLGHQARVAEEGAQALRLWLKEPFDVVISDCNMPRLNGHALARAIREHERRSRRPRCRLLGLTANALVAERRRCKAAGMDDCLFKPLGLDSLVEALADCPAQTSTRGNVRMLELQHLQQLVGGDQAALAALLADLRASNLDDLARLDSTGDSPRAIAELAHRVKGGARIARADALVACCEAVERSCASQQVDVAQMRRQVEAMAEAMRQLEQQLQGLATQREATPTPGHPGDLATSSYPTEQQQNQQDHQHHADDAGRAVAPAARVREDR